MKALYIELAIVWALVAACNFVFYASAEHLINLFAGILSAASAVSKIYFAGKES